MCVFMDGGWHAASAFGTVNVVSSGTLLSGVFKATTCPSGNLQLGGCAARNSLIPINNAPALRSQHHHVPSDVPPTPANAERSNLHTQHHARAQTTCCFCSSATVTSLKWPEKNGSVVPMFPRTTSIDPTPFEHRKAQVRREVWLRA